MCCHWIKKAKFNDVCVLLKHANFCSRMLEIHFKTVRFQNFPRNSCLCCEFFPSPPTPKLLLSYLKSYWKPCQRNQHTHEKTTECENNDPWQKPPVKLHSVCKILKYIWYHAEVLRFYLYGNTKGSCFQTQKLELLYTTCLHRQQRDAWRTNPLSLGTLSKDDDNGSEKVGKKMNLCSFKLSRVYLDPFNMSNAGDFSWSWILRDFIQVQKEEGKFVVLCPHSP